MFPPRTVFLKNIFLNNFTKFFLFIVNLVQKSKTIKQCTCQMAQFF